MSRFGLGKRPGTGGLSTGKPCTLVTLGLVLALSFVFTWEARSGRSIVSIVDKRADRELQATIDSILYNNATSISKEPVAAAADGSPAEDERAAEAEAEAEPKPEAAASDEMQDIGGELTSADELQLWKLTHSMMYWAHSNPVPKPSHGELFAAPAEPHYITWEQDFAGMNNVRYQVEVLVVMGHLFRRTLVMPDHLTSSMDHLHEFGRQQLADFFDFHDLSTWVPVITMQQYLDVRGVAADDEIRHDTGKLRDYLRGEQEGWTTVYPKWDANGEVMPVPYEEYPLIHTRQNPSWDQFKQRASKVLRYDQEMQQARSLHFKTEGEYRLFGNLAGFWFWPTQGWQDYYMAGMRDHFHFHHDIVANASRIVHHLHKRFGVEGFNCLHDRVDDFKAQFPHYFIDEHKLREHVQMVLGDSTLPLYIATKQVNESRFAPLHEVYTQVVYLKDVVDDVLPGINPMYLGPIEQMVCSVATRFVGTFGSTFSGFVHRLRGHQHPGLVPDKGVYYTNFPFQPEEYADLIANNEPWAKTVWWPQEGRRLFADAMWAREFSLTWDFSESEVAREHSVFNPARRRLQQQQRQRQRARQ